MYRLYGIPTQNTLKVAYVLDAVGKDYEYKVMDLKNKEQKSEEFLKINPIGKVPALKHDDFSVFESGAICRYVANVENSELYPKDAEKRAQVDQWMDFFSCHAGRWMSSLFFEKVLKPKMGFGESDQDKVKEAEGFLDQQLPPVENHLAKTGYFVGEKPTITDFVAFAYIDQGAMFNYDLSAYPHIQNWLKKMDALPSVKKTKEKIKF